MIKGIDISHWQGTINWDAVKPNIDFAIIKVGGSDGGLYSDSQWLRNNNEVNRLNIPRMFYYFLGGGNPRQEAEHFAGILGTLFVGEGVCLDYEIDHPDEENYLADCTARLKELIGFPPIIYMDSHRVHRRSWQRVRDLGCGLWEASWSATPPNSGPWPFWALWQTSSSGAIPGIAGNVDTDYFASDSIEVFKKYGKPAPLPPPPPPLPPVIPPPSTSSTSTTSSTSSTSSSSSSTTTKLEPPTETGIQTIIAFLLKIWKAIIKYLPRKE